MRNEETRMNKYIQCNALANEIITIKRFITFYAINPPFLTGIIKVEEIFSYVASAGTINTQFSRIVCENLTS